MYIPRHFAMNPARVTELLQAATTAQVVTAHEDGPAATLLPLLWRPDAEGEGWGSLIFHVARVNPLWKRPYLGEALAILSGPEGYIHADWFSSQQASPGVSTWNYATVHAYGPLVIHEDPAWVLAASRQLSSRHGADLDLVDPDAVEKMLRAIVGIELRITRVEAKDKLSQNRSPEDVQGAIDGVRATGNESLADAMTEVSVPHAEARYRLLRDLGQRKRLGVPRT